MQGPIQHKKWAGKHLLHQGEMQDEASEGRPHLLQSPPPHSVGSALDQVVDDTSTTGCAITANTFIKGERRAIGAEAPMEALGTHM